MEIKAGDKVRCIKASEVGGMEWGIVGRTYIANSSVIVGDYGDTVLKVIIDGIELGCYANRFELADKKRPKLKLSDLLATGDS